MTDKERRSAADCAERGDERRETQSVCISPTHRDFGLDLTRAAAATLVLTVHFFLNTGFYDMPLRGSAMALGLMLRMASITGVPAFMMLTGYLCVSRRWSAGYYRKLLPIMLIYLLSALGCLVFRALWLKENMSPLGWARRILDFTADPYGWYVEMYIGLFLLSPFINAAWSALESKGKLALTVTLVAMTALPPVFNVKWQILPDWWMRIYPLTYYVLGAYMREHPIRCGRGWMLMGWLGIAAGSGLVMYLYHQSALPGQPMRSTAFNYLESAIVVAEAVCLFSALSRCTGARVPKWLRRCVSRIAKLSLPMYLLSYINDSIIYPPLLSRFPTMGSRLPFLPVMVLISLALSGLMAQIADWAADALLRLLNAALSGLAEKKPVNRR